MSVRVWAQGRMVGDGPAVSVLDHGVTVGDGAFETCKVVDGEVFARTMHHARLDRSLNGLGLPGADREFLDSGIEQALQGLSGLVRLRYTVTSGVGPLGSDRGDGSLTHLVMATPIDPPPPAVAVATVPWPRNERSAVAGLKTTSYAENVVALASARERGATEALLPNTRGELCEGTGSNIFVILDGEVLTPPLSSGALAGITRELVIRWGRAEGVPIREQVLDMDILQRCDEAFLTSSTRDVQPIDRVDERALPPQHPVTDRLATAFAQHADQEPDPRP
ncbi:aminotransferase class IV [Dermacoccaceae bacterium W4C1]